MAKISKMFKSNLFQTLFLVNLFLIYKFNYGIFETVVYVIGFDIRLKNIKEQTYRLKCLLINCLNIVLTEYWLMLLVIN